MARKTASTDASVVQNAVKTLYTNIQFAGIDKRIQSIVLTSSIPNEGKTTIARQLGAVIARGDKQVLLVECDMRRRSLADLLGVHARHGLYAVLSGQVSLEDAVVSTRQLGTTLYFLDAEPHIVNPADILSSNRFKRLMEAMEQAFDCIIFDTPPVGTFVDAAIIAALADATVLVVRENYARRADVLSSYDQLKKADANIVGVTLNYCKERQSEYYYSYYHKDDVPEEHALISNRVLLGEGAAEIPPQRAQARQKPRGSRFKQ